MATDEQAIGERIRAAREKAGLTQLELAEAIPCGGGRQQISNWEAGFRTPRREAIKRIAEITGVSPAWIVYGE